MIFWPIWSRRSRLWPANIPSLGPPEPTGSIRATGFARFLDKLTRVTGSIAGDPKIFTKNFVVSSKLGNCTLSKSIRGIQSIRVSETSVGGLSLASRKAILDALPKGIAIYCGRLPHCIYV